MTWDPTWGQGVAWAKVRARTQGSSHTLSLCLHLSQAGSEVGVAADEDRGSERPPGLGLREALPLSPLAGGLAPEETAAPRPCPPALCLGTPALPGTYSGCQGPSPQPSTRGAPQPRRRAARGNKGLALPAQAPTPLPAPGTEGPRAPRSPRAKQPPPLCPRCEKPPPAPQAWCSPVLKMGRLGLPGGLVAETSCFQCRGARFPLQGTRSPVPKPRPSAAKERKMRAADSHTAGARTTGPS